MRVVKVITLLAILATVGLPAWSQESKFSLGLYAVVDNMAEAKAFYQQVFESEPVVDNGFFVGFRISGGLFALYSADAFAYPLVRGNNVVPYIRVDDIDAEFKRIKALGVPLVQDEVLEEGPIKLFMFMDPSGNPVEFYSLGTR